jgi:hypothetical protein
MLTIAKTVVCTALLLGSLSAQAGVINVLLNIERVVGLVGKSVAATYARTGHAAGAPPLKPGGCAKSSATGALVVCDNSDTFTHPTPPGSDVALAHADAVGFRFLFGNVSTNATAHKGDFAVAGAFAKAGLNFSADGGTDFKLGAKLGPLTLTASTDPGISNYHLQITDLGVNQYNADIVHPLLVKDVLETDSSVAGAAPAHVFYDLQVSFNASTGDYTVSNTSDFLSEGQLLTAADFVVGTFPELDPFGNTIMMPGITLRDAALGDFALTLPGSVDPQNISADAMQFAIAIPEPGVLALCGIGLLAGWLVRRRPA